MPAGRIQATITTKPPRRWWLTVFALLIDTHPDHPGDDGATVEVHDTARGQRWTVPARNADHARYLRDRVAEQAAALSEDELDEWAASGRWTTIGTP